MCICELFFLRILSKHNERNINPQEKRETMEVRFVIYSIHDDRLMLFKIIKTRTAENIKIHV